MNERYSRSFISAESGGLLAVGEAAHQLLALRRAAEALIEALGAVPVWLSPLRSRQVDMANHPQALASEHQDGLLSHAACLPFWAELTTSESALYAGINTVHRREPLRGLDIQGRLEVFHVAEFMIVGDTSFCEITYARTKSAIGAFLSERTQGEWRTALDSFATEIHAKEEWIAGKGAQSIAVASGNRHGTYFLTRRGLKGESCCFGIGLERLYKARQQFGCP